MQNSETKKQAITEKAEWIVNYEVYTNCSYLITELASNEKYTDELMEIMSIYTDNSEEIEKLEEHIDGLEERTTDLIDQVSTEESNDSFMYYDQDTVDAFLSLWIDGLESINAYDVKDLQDEIEELESEQEYPDEALEHWIVSKWLAGKLEAKGQMVMDFNNLMIWGRTTSGQAIAMDYIMESIAEDLMS